MARTDWRTKLRIHSLDFVLFAALCLTVLFWVALPLLGMLSSFSYGSARTRKIPIDTGTGLPSGLKPPTGTTLHGENVVELHFLDPDLGERLLLTAPHLVGGLLLVAVLVLLSRVARTFHDRDVFIPRNARRLNLVALAVLLIGTLVPFLDTLTTRALVAGTPLAERIQVMEPISAFHVFLALLITSAAAAFRHGAALRADTEGLV
jgi:hypothetical protein